MESSIKYRHNTIYPSGICKYQYEYRRLGVERSFKLSICPRNVFDTIRRLRYPAPIKQHYTHSMRKVSWKHIPMSFHNMFFYILPTVLLQNLRKITDSM